MEKRYLLTISTFDKDKDQVTIVDQKAFKVIHQSTSERAIIPDLIHAFAVLYGDEIKITDKTLSQFKNEP